MTADWGRARAIADAVLYEGYLLYPYRANSRKNQTRWQFGVLGPAGAADAGIGEDDSLSAQVLVAPRGKPDGVGRGALPAAAAPRRREGHRRRRDSSRSTSWCRDAQSWLRWDEAVEREISFGPFDIESGLPQTLPIEIDAGTDIETVDGGRLVRTRRALQAQLEVAAERDDGFVRLTMTVRNIGRARRRQGRGDRRVAHRHAPRRRRSTTVTSCRSSNHRHRPTAPSPGAGTTAASRCWPDRPATMR